MRQRRPSRVCGAFDIVFERTAVSPGDTVAGVVLLQLLTPIADAVDVRGRERVEFKDNVELKTETSSHSIWFYAVARRHQSLTTEGIDIPFSVELPTDLPGSAVFEFASRRDVQTKVLIDYEIVCSVHVPDDKTFRIEKSVSFTIVPLPLARRVGRSIRNSHTRDFRHAYLFKKSSCRVAVELNSDVFTVDTVISAHVHIKLEDRERLQGLSMSLRRKLVPNLSLPFTVSPESNPVTMTRVEKSTLSRLDELSLQLRIPPTMLAECGPLKPTLAFHHFTVVYEVAVTCEVKSCSPITLHFPVLLLPPVSSQNRTHSTYDRP